MARHPCPAPALALWDTFMAAAVQALRLSASEQVTRRDKEGRQVALTRWLHPKLLGTEVSA